MIYTILNILLLIANVLLLRKRVPKWDYYKEGIRFYNKKGKVTIEYDKPLK